MNLSEIKLRRDIENEYKSRIPSILETLKAAAMAELLADIETVTGRATATVHDMLIAHTKELDAKIEAVKLMSGDPGKDAVVDYEKITSQIKKHMPAPVPGKDAVVDYKRLARLIAKNTPKPDPLKPQNVDYGFIITKVIELMPAPVDGEDAVVDQEKLLEELLKRLPKQKKHGGGSNLTVLQGGVSKGLTRFLNFIGATAVNNNGTIDVTVTAETSATIVTKLNAATGIKRTILLTANGLISTTNGATAPVQFETTTNKQNYKPIAFSNSGTPSAEYLAKIPRGWDKGTVTFYFDFSANTASTANVRFTLEAVAISSGATLDAAYGSAVGVTRANTGSRQRVESTQSAVLTISNAANSNFIKFRVRRDNTVGSNLAADAELHMVEVIYGISTYSD